MKEVKKKKSNEKLDNFINSKKYKLLVLGTFIISFTVALITMFITQTPTITLENDEVSIVYNENYDINNFKASNKRKDYTSEVQIENNIDNTKIGTYYVEYKLKYGISNITKKLKVNVIDNKAPEITLKGNKDIKVCPNKTYEEEGYTALDEYDGDLTNNVLVTKEENKIIYKVSDLSNNETTIERNVKYIDDEKPKINIKGNTTYYVKYGSKYTDPGYTATDNCDGTITDKVKVSGSVNTKKEGKYTITYTVKDMSNNETTSKRTVWVYKSNNTNANLSGGEKGVIYLTFDDGPNNTITKQILDILKEENVKATFFVTNKGSDSIIKREYNEGHTVALHTASHDYSKVYSSVDNYFKDLDLVQARVKRITGVESKIIRFPGGSSNTVSRNYDKGIKIMTILTSEVLNRGYKYYDWNVDSGDAGNCVSASNKSNCVYKNVTKNLSKKRSNIVLMHDIKSYTKDALRDIIAYGKANGYTFKAITTDTTMITQRVNN